MKIQRETENLTIFESELYRTTSTLIKEKDYILLVDPNWLAGEVEFIYQYISKLNTGQEKFLLFTHSDYDHIIGYGKFQNYTTIASKNFVQKQKCTRAKKALPATLGSHR